MVSKNAEKWLKRGFMKLCKFEDRIVYVRRDLSSAIVLDEEIDCVESDYDKAKKSAVSILSKYKDEGNFYFTSSTTLLKRLYRIATDIINICMTLYYEPLVRVLFTSVPDTYKPQIRHLQLVLQKGSEELTLSTEINAYYDPNMIINAEYLDAFKYMPNTTVDVYHFIDMLVFESKQFTYILLPMNPHT